MEAVRQTDAGFEWAEQLLGGQIVHKQQHERWRPQWFLKIDTGAKDLVRVVMRGYRSPGYASPDESSARAMLKIEANMLRTLQSLPVRVPKFWGYSEHLGWMLMDWVEGSAELTEVLDASTRHNIFREYMSDIATLHSQPIERITVPDGIMVPKNTHDLIKRYFDEHVACFRQQPKRVLPEPLLEFGIQWLKHNALVADRPMRLGLGDIGPNQFMFEGSHYKSMLDFEYAIVADPLMEIGLMRSREMTYPIGQMGDHIEHYGRCFERLTGDALDVKALHYWTVFGVVVWPLVMNRAIQSPDPLLADQVFLYSWEVHHRRCIAESLAEQYGIVLHLPELPSIEDSGETVLGPLHNLLIAQLENSVTANSHSVSGRSFSRYTAAIAQTTARGNTVGPKLNADNLEELTDLLGHRPRTLTSGLWELEALVAENYDKDFDKRVRFFHRFELRKEYLYEPMQAATGCASRSPLGLLAARTLASNQVSLPD